MLLYTVTVAAKELGISRDTVHKRIQAGTIQAERVGHLWIIYGSEVERLKANPPPIGRPKGRQQAGRKKARE